MTVTVAPTTLDHLPELYIKGALNDSLPRSRTDPLDQGLDLAPGRYVVKGFEIDIKAETDNVKNEEWFRTPPLTQSVIDQLTSIQLFTDSHDQGWVDDPSSGNWTWFELEICEGFNDGSRGLRKLSKGQILSWKSHMNHFISKEYLWSRGRLFTKEDDLLKLLRPGDVISIRVCARFPGWENHARAGYLVLGLSRDHFDRDSVDVPSDDVTVPIILACAQQKSEGLMLPKGHHPGDAFSTTGIRGGVHLLGRLLHNSDSNWTVSCHALEDSQADGAIVSGPSSPEVHTFYELGRSKTTDSLPAVKRYTLHNSVVIPKVLDVVQGGLPKKPKIVLLDDAGVNKDGVQLPEYQDADLLIYQMSAPLFKGKIWDEVSKGPKSNGKHREKKQEARARLVVSINADDLRAEGMQLSFRLSWEKTMEDFRRYFAEHIKPTDVEGLHLLVRCGHEGVFYLRPGSKFTFHMMPDKTEGDILESRKGLIPGIDSAFVSGLAASLVLQGPDSLANLGSTQFEAAIKLALKWSNRFASIGFRKDEDGSFNYPSAKDLNVDIFQSDVSIIKFDETSMRKDGKWSIFSILGPLTLPVAAKIVKASPKEIVSLVPTARFGALLTADRVEIEGFRATAAVVDEYLQGTSSKPLSLAVFGPPGSGKSFGIKQVIKAVTKGQGRGKSDPLEVNLSQFTAYSDLVTTFHTIRDMALGGDTPVVLFDEFDSSFKEPLGWLKYLLAPMQDGKFLDDGHNRPLGRAIFVFIGGTSSSFGEFSKIANDQTKSAKKPDFISRLSAYIDIRGPNSLEKRPDDSDTEDDSDEGDDTGEIIENDEGDEDGEGKKNGKVDRNDENPKDGKEDGSDNMFPIRRAILLRSILESRLSVEPDTTIIMDENLLRALLQYPAFNHGARSLDLIVAMSRLSCHQKFVPSALPSDNQLGMHVNVQEFKDMMRRIEPLNDDPNLAVAKYALRQGDNQDFVIAILGKMAKRRKFRPKSYTS